MKISAIIFGLLITCGVFAYLNSNSSIQFVEGQHINGFFKPKEQYWQVAGVKQIDPDKTPKDLKGVPLILKGSPVYIMPNYVTVKSINSGGDYIIPACYTKEGSTLEVTTWGKSKKVLGKTFTLTQADDKLLLQYGKWFNLVLEPKPKPDNFDYRKKQLDSTYNRIFDRGYIRGSSCKLAKIELETQKPQNLSMKFKESGKTITLADALLDPSTSLRQSSSRSSKPVNISDKNIELQGCVAEYQRLIAMVKSTYPRSAAKGEIKDGFYILQGFYGKDQNQKPCDRVTAIKDIPYQPLMDEYGIKEGKYRENKLSFKNWNSPNSIIVANSQVTLLLSDLDSNSIKVKIFKEQ